MGSQLIISPKKRKLCCSSSLRIKSPAKLNLYLNILGPYPNGFHRIQSIVERLSLCDEIILFLTKNKRVEIACSDSSLADKNNLCFKAISLVKRRYALDRGFKLFLKKCIPVGAGLGGGSSNAASTLIALDQILGLNLPESELLDLGAILGSDVNFFLKQCRYAQMSGRGELVEPWLECKPLQHVIIWPGVSVSTKKVYAQQRGKLTKKFNSVNIIQYAVKSGDSSLIKKGIYNALEPSAYLVSPVLRQAKKLLDSASIPVYLTGSGSAFYTVSSGQDAKAANRLAAKVRRIAPKNWRVFRCHTF